MVLLVFGISSAYALVSITLAGDVIIIGNLNTQGTIEGPTIEDLQTKFNVLKEKTDIPVSGYNFILPYKISGGNINTIIVDLDSNSLIIDITSTQDGQLIIILPRALIDAKIGDSDDDFFVLVDGEEVAFNETKTLDDRTLTIDFTGSSFEIEIIGTFIALP